MAAFIDLFGIGEAPPASTEEGDTELLTGHDEWRHPEFTRIRETPSDDYLAATDVGIHDDLAGHLTRRRSVDTLRRQTRALRGFTRVRDDVLKLSEGKALLRRSSLLPARDGYPRLRRQGRGDLSGADLIVLPRGRLSSRCTCVWTR